MKFRRKQYLTNKRYQFRMLGLLFVIVFIGTFIAILATHYFTLSAIVHQAQQAKEPPELDKLIFATFQPLIIVSIVIFMILTPIIIYISHRIAGPLYRLKMYMKKVSEGNFTSELHFRKFDEIHDVADTFNEMIAKLREMNQCEGKEKNTS